MQEISLPDLIKYARQAQGLRQTQLAMKLQVYPSAISQFEKSLASISMKKLISIAPLLNLNPQFLTEGNVNPFKQRHPDKIIQMYLSTRPDGAVRKEGVLDLIIKRSRPTIFSVLDIAEAPVGDIRRRWQKKHWKSYAILVQDEDNNIFIFKRKDDVFFNASNLVGEIQELWLLENKPFALHFQSISDTLYNHIKKWKINKKLVTPLLRSSKVVDAKGILLEILDMAVAHVPSIPNNKYSSLKSNIERTMGILGFVDIAENDKDEDAIVESVVKQERKEAERIISKLMPDLYSILEKYFS